MAHGIASVGIRQYQGNAAVNTASRPTSPASTLAGNASVQPSGARFPVTIWTSNTAPDAAPIATPTCAMDAEAPIHASAPAPKPIIKPDAAKPIGSALARLPPSISAAKYAAAPAPPSSARPASCCRSTRSTTHTAAMPPAAASATRTPTPGETERNSSTTSKTQAPAPQSTILRTAVRGSNEKPMARTITAANPAPIASPIRRVWRNKALKIKATTNGATPACTAGFARNSFIEN